MKKYKIIYADPPWRYDQKRLQGVAEKHYATMNINDICALPVADLADKDCVLFLWATFPMLPEALKLIQAWGFEYKTVAFVWLKQNKKTPSWFYGLGFWTRGNAEVCLLAKKGKPKRSSASVHQFIISPVEQHSKKPDITRERIVELMGDVPRIELFARQKAEGWDVWGNEAPDSINCLLYTSFEAVKQSVTTRQAAEHYGIRVGRNGMCVCPFHDDKNPSMKVDRRFHCFGCQADGDVIDFVSRLENASPKEAALMLVQDFSIPYEDREPPGRSRPKRKPRQESPEQQFKRMERHCFRVLSDYHKLLRRWKRDYAPKTPEEEWHPLFVEALQKQSHVEYLLDVLLFSDIMPEIPTFTGS